MSPQAEPFELSQRQQWKLLDFIDRFDQTYDEGSFDPDADYSDPGLIALALRAAELMGFQDAELEQLFETEFELTGITGGKLETVLSMAILIDAERRVRCAAGGRN
jgi:hypothetical protein